MDPFAQRMFEKAEQRSRALGISNTSKFLTNEESNNMDGAAVTTSGAGGDGVAKAVGYEQAANKQLQQQQQQQQPSDKVRNFFSHTTTGFSNKLQVVEKNQTSNMTCEHSPNKVLRQFSAMDKENMEVGIEINIMADKNLEVQVQVEEQDITDGDDEVANERQNYPEHVINEPLARIRDTSRNRLQRLGALYSNTADLSSPIHRTEGRFHAEAGHSDDDTGLDTSPKKINKQRYGKLVTLANSINQWEDDIAHQVHSNVVPPPKPDLPSRHVANKKGPAPPPPTTNKTPTKQLEKNNEKLLKWDPKVINSLEAQGFQRRESSTVKYAYDYANANTKTQQQQQKQSDEVDDGRRIEIELPTKSAKNFGNAKCTDDEKNLDKQNPCHVKQGLVSGRAAAFEKASQQQQNNQQQQQKPQKDPTELSLKERRLLFERNKGEALLPKAAFGMAPPVNKIRQEVTAALKKDEALRATANAVAVKSNADSKVRDKVAAFVANVQSSNSDNKIHNEVQKQRREEMAQLSNRFSKQKEVFGVEKSVNNIVKVPPPPPPPPAHMNVEILKKRRSPANALDVPEEEEKKRARKSHKNANRLYPGLSDIENSDAEKEQHRALVTPSTASAHSSNEEENERLRLTANQRHICGEEDDENSNESYMEGDEGEEDNLCNVSLGREILQVVHNNDLRQQQQQQQQHEQQQQRRNLKEVRYADKNHYYDDVRSRNAGDDSSLNSSETSAGVDDLMNDAIGDGDDDYTQGEEDEDDVNASGRSKCTTASKSFSFRKAPGNSYMDCQTIAEEPTCEEAGKSCQQTGLLGQPVKSELTVNEHQDQNMVTLVHTVSFYRRQQNSASSTPVRTISREQQVLRPMAMNTPEPLHTYMELQQSTPYRNSHTENESEGEEELATEENNEQLVQSKIKKLLDEVCKQQTIISQTSQALNLCAATVEFSGSTESVEGERHLLVATHRRQACLDEVQRLRVEKCLRSDGVAKEKGCLTVKEITVPLRQDYIRKLAADTISGHHLVCLLKYNEHVLATRSVPTLPGLLAVKFPNVLTLNNVYADFRITLEIYGMTAQREILPHEVKYHINLPKKSGIKTPKKKHGDNRLVMPPVQSPAGPQAVRTPALVQYGFAIFSLREIQRTTWTLTQVREISPLEGAVHMKVNCELSVSVEHKGFLTMFEDISGFGAWHRRWCYLNGAIVSYWKYPDDEKKKAPLGSIDLYTCTSQKVNTAPRDICARLNTMLIECQRPAKDTDQESLIIVPNGRTTIVRHLWSADTKEEREVWCAHLNKALTLLRAWGSPQQ